MVGPDYKRPPPADPPSVAFKETTGPVSVRPPASSRPCRATPSIAAWWSMYDDQTLDRLAALIDISNQTLMQADRSGLSSARALVRQDSVRPLSHGHRQRRLPPQSGSGSGGSLRYGGWRHRKPGSAGQFTAGRA